MPPVSACLTCIFTRLAPRLHSPIFILVVPLPQKLFGVHNEREAKPLTILNDLQGRLVPGRLTLLLGPPSCGKSSFMRALTGRLMPAQGRVRRGRKGVRWVRWSR